MTILGRAGRAVSSWAGEVVGAWDAFWFTPRPPHTLALIRIAAGALLLYTHLVLALDLMAFLGPDAWISNEAARRLHDGSFAPAEASRSYLWWIESRAVLWIHQGLALGVAGALMMGLLTRVTAPLAWLLQLMYMHRLTGSLFGLDQILTFLTMYLMLAPCGAVFSLDAIIRRRLERRYGAVMPKWVSLGFPDASPSVMAGVATRLAQVHLCLIYLFGGLWKARGTSWWDGSAMWLAAANREYQSNDLTWIAQYPFLIAALSHLTVFWEIFYSALVWPRLTRPLVLAMAFLVHAGIAVFLGMITFGTSMIIANAIFVEPEWVRAQLPANPPRSGGRPK